MQSCVRQTDILQPITITLDNTQSNVAVGWQATIEDDVPQTTTAWAIATPASGAVPAGQTSTLQLRPDASVCAHIFSQVNFHAKVSLTSVGSGSYTFTETVGYEPLP